MKTGLSSITILLLAAIFLMFCNQTPISVGEGSASETIIGTVYNSDGLPASQTEVTLIPHDYKPHEATVPLEKDTTDADGNFSFEQVSAGKYNIQALHLDKKTSVFVSGVVRESGKTDIAVSDTLREPVSAVFELPDSLTSLSGTIYLEGSTIYKDKAHQAGPFVMGSIPPGLYPNISIAKEGVGSIVIYNDVRIDESGVTIGDMVWGNASKIFIDTSPEGADINSDQYSFPLLVRLDDNNFDYTQTDENGSSLRFVKPDGSLLPHEIELWDPISQSGYVWVQIDTVYANSPSQFIYLFCVSDGTTVSQNDIVFDTSAGFLSVWHFNENPEQPSYHRDATPYRLRAFEDLSQGPVKGIIGNAQFFDGKEDNIDLGNPDHLTFDGPFTLSLWLNTDWETAPKEYQYIVDNFKADTISGSNAPGSGFSLLTHVGRSGNNRLQFMIYSEDGTGSAITDLLTGTGWKHIAAVYSGDDLRIYIDGIQANYFENTPPPGPPLRSVQSITLGKREYDAEGFNFAGIMDEVRFCGVARSEDWIKLSYEAEKENSTTVKISP